MESGPKDSTKFDPHRTPFTSPAPRFTYIDIPLHGQLMVNSDTKIVTPIPDQPPLPAVPIRLPEALMEVAQPHIRTCGPPGEKYGAGCTAAMNGGCAIYNQFGRVGPCNVIIEKHGRVDSVACHHYYVGVTASGRPAHGAGYSLNGWRVLTDRTSTTHHTKDGKKNVSFQMPVENLAPFYDHLKNGNAAEPEKKRRGRPKKVA